VIPIHDPVLDGLRAQLAELQRAQFDPRTLTAWPDILAWWVFQYGHWLTRQQVIDLDPELANPLMFRKLGCGARATKVPTETYVIYRLKQRGPYAG
jgi:hypothetical protein